MRRTIAFLAGVLVVGFAAWSVSDTIEDDLAAMQGRWSTTLTDQDGKPLVALKEIKGNRETYSLLKDQEIVLKREVEFKLSRLDERVRLFTVIKVVPLTGPEAGRTHETDGAYLYRIDGATLVEVQGILIDKNLVESPALLRWQRVPDAPPGEAAKTVRLGTLRPQSPQAGQPGRADSPHTFDGRYDIATIDLTVVYLVPKDRSPLVDWRERIDYFMGRITAFHQRESGGRSALRIRVHPEPLLAGRTADELRGDHPDRTFENSLDEARLALKWPGRREGFPILLVLSEINWRELDDFQRTRLIDGVPRFEGSRDAEGHHVPGAESGGARSTYRPDEGIGLGLVSADGWRVPYMGSDCVVYHEAIGHPIGLPHPEPGDDSVMSLGQYRSWINRSWVEESQKRALGWVQPADSGGANGNGRPGPAGGDLFTAFTAVPKPVVPRPDEPVKLAFAWPDRARLSALTVRFQTDVHGPWQSVAVDSRVEPPSELDLGRFARPTPVSYRVNATLENGQSVELWGYFKVEPAPEPERPGATREAAEEKPAGPVSALVGSWECISPQLPQGFRHIKHITPTHFTWVTYHRGWMTREPPIPCTPRVRCSARPAELASCATRWGMNMP